MNWLDCPALFIDTETTGPDKDTAHVVEIGAYEVERLPDVAAGKGSRYGALIRPPIPIPPEATLVHGIGDGDVRDAPTIAEIADRFLARVRDASILGAYNWPYDAAVLRRELGEAWDQAIAGKPVLDPLVVVRFDDVGRYWPGKGRHKLDAVAKRLGIGIHRPADHRASADALTAAAVLYTLRQHLPEDAFEAAALIATEREQQEQRFREWLAEQEAKDAQQEAAQ